MIRKIGRKARGISLQMNFRALACRPWFELAVWAWVENARRNVRNSDLGRRGLL